MQTFDDYQEAAARTRVYPEGAAILYPALGLAGEAGEVCNKIKKVIRDDSCELTDERLAQLREELGDVMWYVAALCTDLQLNLGDICRENAEKLAQRQEDGTLQGDGDTR